MTSQPASHLSRSRCSTYKLLIEHGDERVDKYIDLIALGVVVGSLDETRNDGAVSQRGLVTDASTMMTSGLGPPS